MNLAQNMNAPFSLSTTAANEARLAPHVLRVCLRSARTRPARRTVVAILAAACCGGHFMPGAFAAANAAETPAIVAAASPAALRELTPEADNGALIPALQEQLREATPEQRIAIERELLDVIADETAVMHGRVAACTVLAGFASDAALEVLLPLLTESAQLSRAARSILEPMPGRAVDEALIEALDQASGDTRAGLINALAMRRTAGAVSPLEKMARDSASPAGDAELAVRALGAIGTEPALRALLKLKATESLEAARRDAVILACNLLIDSGKASRLVTQALEKLRASDLPEGVRAAAWRLSLEAKGDRAARDLVSLLGSDERELRLIGAQALDLARTERDRQTLVDAAAEWPAESQALLIEHLSGAGSRTVLPLARASLDAEDAYLQQAATVAVGRVGDASDLDTLFALASEEGEVRSAALSAIGFVPDAEVDARLMAEFRNADSPLREELPEIIAARSYREAIPVLLEAGPQEERAIASEIYKALGLLGTTDLVPSLLEQWQSAQSATRSAIERAIVAIGRRSADGEVANILAPRMDSGDPEVKTSAVRMIGAIADKTSLELLKPLIAAETPDEVAVRSVIAWRGPEAIPVLQSLVVREELEDSVRQSAWRSLLRVSDDNFYEAREEALRGFQTCMMNALSLEDRPQVVETLAGFSGDEVQDMLRGWLLIPGASAAADKALQELEERRRTSGRAL